MVAHDIQVPPDPIAGLACSLRSRSIAGAYERAEIEPDLADPRDCFR